MNLTESRWTGEGRNVAGANKDRELKKTIWTILSANRNLPLQIYTEIEQATGSSLTRGDVMQVTYLLFAVLVNVCYQKNLS